MNSKVAIVDAQLCAERLPHGGNEMCAGGDQQRKELFGSHANRQVVTQNCVGLAT